MSKIITPPYMEDGEIKTEEQLYNYLNKIKELSEEELYIEIYIYLSS